MLGSEEKEGVDMEISFVLDWTSFWIGAAAMVVGAFLTAFVIAAVQTARKRRR